MKNVFNKYLRNLKRKHQLNQDDIKDKNIEDIDKDDIEEGKDNKKKYNDEEKLRFINLVYFVVFIFIIISFIKNMYTRDYIFLDAHLRNIEGSGHLIIDYKFEDDVRDYIENIADDKKMRRGKVYVYLNKHSNNYTSLNSISKTKNKSLIKDNKVQTIIVEYRYDDNNGDLLLSHNIDNVIKVRDVISFGIRKIDKRLTYSVKVKNNFNKYHILSIK